MSLKNRNTGQQPWLQRASELRRGLTDYGSPAQEVGLGIFTGEKMNSEQCSNLPKAHRSRNWHN